MPGSTSYCAGLPLERERPLSPEELARVAALRRTWGLRALARLPTVPLSLAVGAAVADVARAPGGPAAELLAAAAFVLVGLVVPFWAVLHLRVAVVTWRRLVRDVREARALRFASGARSVAVLPHSTLVLEWDGAPAELDRRLPVGTAAEVPASAATYAVDVGTAGTAPALHLVRRPLSPAEREEIESHAARLGRVPLVLPLFTAAFLLLSSRVLGEGEPDAQGGALVAVWALLLGYAWWRFVRARALARRLREDSANGWALRATAGEPAGNEVLAVSGVTWTVQGAPAPWRTYRTRSG